MHRHARSLGRLYDEIVGTDAGEHGDAFIFCNSIFRRIRGKMEEVSQSDTNEIEKRFRNKLAIRN